MAMSFALCRLPILSEYIASCLIESNNPIFMFKISQLGCKFGVDDEKEKHTHTCRSHAGPQPTSSPEMPFF